MEYSKDIIWSYCSNPENEHCKYEILAIVDSRAMSLYQRAKFQDVLKQMQTILEKCIDCRILAQLLLLLQELSPKAKPEITGLWSANSDRNATFKDFFAHDKKQENNCTMCNLVQSSSAYLHRELGLNGKKELLNTSYSVKKEQDGDDIENTTEKSIVTLNCVLCRSVDIKRIMLSCGHPLCRSCVKQAVKKIKNSPDINHFICPVDRNLCGLTSLETKLRDADPGHQRKDDQGIIVGSFSSNDAKDLEVNHANQTKNEIPCPRCKETSCQNVTDGMLAECFACSFCFCSNCLQLYHGNIECPRMGSLKLNKSTSSSSSNPVENYEVSNGALARQYELDFYKNSNQDVYQDDEIFEAFQRSNQTEDIFPAPEWPWEVVSGRTPEPALQYPHPYESLRMGYWVEDELLERVIKIILQQNELQNRVIILESFVMNWGLRKHHDEDDLIKILKQRQLCRKDLIFALINTDTKGHGKHWILAMIIVSKQKILLLDSSLVLSTTYYQKFFFGLLSILHLAHEVDELSPNEKKRFDPRKWRLFVSLDSVQQNNAYDCGPFVVCNAISLATRGTQLDRIPKSFMVREWLHHTLVNFNKKEDDTNVNRVQASHSASDTNPSYKSFTPSGLTIRFKFFKDCILI